MPTDHRTLRRRAMTALVIATVSLVTACANFRDASKWEDAKAKTHFVEACTGASGVENSTTTTLASKDFCVCVFDDLRTVHKLDFDKMLEFEKTLERVSAADPPKVPSQVTKAIETCQAERTAGPPAPSAGDTSTTTNG